MTSNDFSEGFSAGRGEVPFDQSRVLDKQYVQGWREGEKAQAVISSPITGK